MAVQRVAAANHANGGSVRQARRSNRVSAFAFARDRIAAQRLISEALIAIQHAPV